MDFEPLRRALAHVATDEQLWRRVCLPVYDTPPVAETDLPAEIVAALVDGGVVRVERGRLIRRRWVTRQFGRPYFASLHDFSERHGFLQDIWPETHALMERLRAFAPGRMAEIGTGCGAVAIEAALAGHSVVATDIDEGALATAAWNAALHGVSIDLRRGHLTQPLGDETFDLIVSNPHYGGPSDMLRVELLGLAVERLSPIGTLLLGSFLEWDSDGVGLVESLLRDRRVKLHPIVPKVKTRWFTNPEPMSPGLVERGRFVIEVGRQGPHELAFPPREPEVFVPLARLREVRPLLDERTSGAWDRHPVALVTTPDDVAALEALLGDCARGVLELDRPVPFTLHDDCRFGARPCVKAHRAIVDARGGVRPCSHGGVVGTVGDTTAAFHDQMTAMRVDLEARRGCATCSAERVCSKCTFPAVVDEAAYCDLIRRHAAALPVLHRVLRVVGERHPDSVGKQHLRLRFHVAAEGDPTPPLPELRRRLGGAFLYVCDGEAGIDAPGAEDPFPLTPETVPVIERIMDGGGYSDEEAALVYFLTQWLG